MQRSCLVVVAPNQIINGQIVPEIPMGWDLVVESNKWCTLYPQTRAAPDVFLHSRTEVTQGVNSVFCLFGPRSWLNVVQAAVTKFWASIAALRADASGTAIAAKALWVDDRPRKLDGSLVDPTEPRVALRAFVFGYEQDDGETTGP